MLEALNRPFWEERDDRGRQVEALKSKGTKLTTGARGSAVEAQAVFEDLYGAFHVLLQSSYPDTVQ